MTAPSATPEAPDQRRHSAAGGARRPLRPADLAREHGISTQAVRNYERDGCIPPAARTPAGYRVYTETHAAALRAYLALIPAYGYALSGRVMRALTAGDLDPALTEIDRGHAQLLRDRETLAAVGEAVARLTAEGGPAAGSGAGTAPLSVGEVARRLGVTPATLRNWEEAGLLAPVREPGTGYRVYGPEDVRDADLAHLLRRGGYPLEQVAVVIRQIREAGGTEALAAALEDWRRSLTARGAAMLEAAGRLGRYVSLLNLAPPPPRPHVTTPQPAGPERGTPRPG